MNAAPNVIHTIKLDPSLITPSLVREPITIIPAKEGYRIVIERWKPEALMVSFRYEPIAG